MHPRDLDGEHIDEPILSRYIMKSGLDLNILFADVNRLNGKRYGQMLLEKPENPEDGQKFILAMRELGLTAEEVRV